MHAHHLLPKKQTQGLLGRRTVSKETAQQIQIENPKVKVEQPLRTVTNAKREKTEESRQAKWELNWVQISLYYRFYEFNILLTCRSVLTGTGFVPQNGAPK
jgi:hypothetical protein